MAKKECREWGFDLTGFKSSEDFEKLLDRHDIKKHRIICVKSHDEVKKVGESDVNCSYVKYRYSNDDESLILETGNEPLQGCYDQPRFREPEKGFAGYIGITGALEKVKALAKDIKKTAEYVKDESKCRRDFI